MLPNVVLPALLEVEYETWSFTVTISVVGEVEGDNLLRPESTRSKDELMSVGGCISQRPKNAARLRVTAMNNECYSWRPHHRSRSRSLVSNMASTAEKNGGGSLLGPTVERGIGLTKPDASFKSRSAKAQFGATSLGPPASLVHETKAGSSNGGPITPLSSKLQCLGSFAKEVLSIDHSQELSKLKGLSISARRKARSRPPSLKVSPFAPKRNLDGGGSAKANLAIFWGRPVSNKGVLPPVPETFQVFTGETEGGDGFSRCGLANKVCPPFSSSSEQGHPLARAFTPKSLPISSVSVVHLFWCQPFFRL